MRELLTEKYLNPTYIDDDGNKFWMNKYGDLHSTNDNRSIKLTQM